MFKNRDRLIEQTDNPNYDPSTYVSIQKQCNDDLEFREQYIKNKLKNNWEEITPKQLLNEPGQQEFFYIDNNNNFCSGGLLVYHDEKKENGAFLNLRKKKLKYVLYRSRKNSILSLQTVEQKNCKCSKPELHPHPYCTRAWIKREKQRYVRPTNVPDKYYNLESIPPSMRNLNKVVMLPDENGVEQILYYNSRQAKVERFRSTHKFKKAKKYGWVFI